MLINFDKITLVASQVFSYMELPGTKIYLNSCLNTNVAIEIVNYSKQNQQLNKQRWPLCQEKNVMAHFYSFGMFLGQFVLDYTTGLEINLLKVDKILNTNVEKLEKYAGSRRPKSFTCRDRRETFHACVIDVIRDCYQNSTWRFVHAIVSTLLPNTFVLIGLAALGKTLVFCCSLDFALLGNRAEQKSHFVANKTQRCLKKRSILVQTLRRRPILSQHGRRRRRFV